MNNTPPTPPMRPTNGTANKKRKKIQIAVERDKHIVNTLKQNTRSSERHCIVLEEHSLYFRT